MGILINGQLPSGTIPNTTCGDCIDRQSLEKCPIDGRSYREDRTCIYARERVAGMIHSKTEVIAKLAKEAKLMSDWLTLELWADAWRRLEEEEANKQDNAAAASLGFADASSSS